MEMCGDFGISFDIERQITTFPKALTEETYDGYNMIIAATLRRNIAIITYYSGIKQYKFKEFSLPDSNYIIRDLIWTPDANYALLAESDESIYYFRFNAGGLVKGVEVNSKAINSIFTMALLDNSLYLGGSLNEYPYQGFIHKNYYTLNETIPGMEFNFTNSSI